MTEQINSAIERIIDTSDYKYSHFGFIDDTGKAFDLAIRSLNAWEEVLYELQHTRSASSEIFNQGIRVAEMIINQHLAEIEK